MRIRAGRVPQPMRFEKPDAAYEFDAAWSTVDGMVKGCAFDLSGLLAVR